MPDTPPPTPPTSTFASSLIFITLLLAIALLLIFQLQPGAPIWAVPAGTLAEQMALTRMQHLDAQFESTAAGKNLELKLIGFDPQNERQSVMIGAIYYRANYALYPRHVWVGRDDALINTADDIMHADTVPPDSWLKRHNVANVEAILFSPDAPLNVLVRPVR